MSGKKVLLSEVAVSPSVGTLLLVALGVIMAVSVMGIAGIMHLSKAPYAVLDVKAEITESGLQRITLTHRGGDVVVLSEIKIVTEVNGVPLQIQLPGFPLKSCVGFAGFKGAGGVLCSKGDYWQVGDTGWFNIAKKNRRLKVGDVVKVTVVHKPSGLVISVSEAQVR
jgi:FlaG/FlaF family flagellin (archaellin)